MQNQKLCLKWNNHMSNMLSLLGSFQQKDMLVDVTISCQGQNIKAHKIILSACSPYFQNIFMENPCQHPIIIINGMKFEDITAILNFMYKGEVNVSHDGLSSFLQAAEALKVKGLAEVCGEKKGTNTISQEVQQSELNRPQRTDTPPRKRPRNRKRSLSDSNRSDDEGLTRKHREPSSPEVHELSGDESFTGDNSSNGPAFNTISRVPQNVYSRSHQSSSNMGGEDDDEYDVVESNKMLDATDSNVSMNNTNTDNNLRIERIMGNATEIESSSMADPESPPDIKPIINFGESSAGPSESGNMMLYNEQSQPGPSSVQDSSLLHDNSHAQEEDIKLNLQHLPWPTTFKIPVEKFSFELRQSIMNGTISTNQKHELVNHLALEIAQYTENPTQPEKDKVAITLIEAFPQLMKSDIISINGLSELWSLILDDKIQEINNKGSNSMEKILKQLDDIRNNIRLMTGEIKKLKEKEMILKANENPTVVSAISKIAEVKDFENLPLPTVSDLANLEDEITADTLKATSLARFLCRGGAFQNVNSLINIIMKRLLARSVAMQYSLEGRKRKRKFCDLNLFNVVIASVKMIYEDVEIADIRSRVGKVLAGSSDWDGNRSNRKEKTNKEHSFIKKE